MVSEMVTSGVEPDSVTMGCDVDGVMGRSKKRRLGERSVG